MIVKTKTRSKKSSSEETRTLRAEGGEDTSEIIPIRMTLQLIPARHGVAVACRRGARVEVVNTHGQQVVDTWAFVDAREWMSMEHSRLHMGKLNPVVGDTLVTNRRRAILTLVADTSGGVHDTLLAACDRERYELLGASEPHDNCTDNLHAALADARPRRARDAEPAEPVRERPARGRRDAGDRAAGLDPRQLGHVPRRTGRGARVLGLPAGPRADQRPRPDRRPLPGARVSLRAVLVGGLVALVGGVRAPAHRRPRLSHCRRELFVPGGDLSLWPPGVRCTYGEPAMQDVVFNGWFWFAATAIVIAVGIVGALATVGPIRPWPSSRRPPCGRRPARGVS